MITLVILILSFSIFWLVNKYVFQDRFSISYIGRTALAILLLFTGISHFFLTQQMVEMLPDFVPYKVEVVYFTGVLELLGAVGLIIHRTAKWTSIALILFFVAILPANIVAYLKQVELGGNGPGYLYFRIPLQLFFIWWTYYFGIRKLQTFFKAEYEVHS